MSGEAERYYCLSAKTNKHFYWRAQNEVVVDWLFDSDDLIYHWLF
jgi:hypothetical protein